MRSAGLALLAFSAALGSAQGRLEGPFRLELGAFFPDYRGADFGNDLGVAAALGYDVCRKGDMTLGGSLRGAYHLATAGGAGDGFGPSSPENGDLTVTSAFVDARYHKPGCHLFGGVGLGIGRATIDDGRDHTGLLLAVEGGVDVSSSVYVALRYAYSGPDALRGATASLGFRF